MGKSVCECACMSCVHACMLVTDVVCVSKRERERERILNEIGEQSKNFNYLYGLKVELYLMKMLPQNV